MDKTSFVREPSVKAWEFHGKHHAGQPREVEMINLASVARDFGLFAADASCTCLDLRQHPVALVGDVYDREGFEDGARVITSTVLRVEKILPEAEGTVLEQPPASEPTFCAVTASGSRYHFGLDDITETMSELIKTALT